MYLREEIKAGALVQNLAGFTRFFPIAGLSHGKMVNASNIARDAGVSRTIVNGHLEILEDTLLSFCIPAFKAGLRVRERKHPKLYWCDPGLARTVVRLSRRGLFAEERRCLGKRDVLAKAGLRFRKVFLTISWRYQE